MSVKDEMGRWFFIEKQRVPWEAKEPMRERPHGALGGEGVGGPPSPSLDGPSGFAGIRVYRSSEAPGHHS